MDWHVARVQQGERAISTDPQVHVRFLARADGYELALIAPSPAAPPRSAVEPLVRLRFPGEGVEVVLTLAEFATLSTDARRLWEYLRCEQARRASHD